MTLRQKVADFLDHEKVSHFITGVILFNAVILGMETSVTIMDRIGPVLVILDTICVAIFVVEISAKLFAQRLKFFTSSWNIFDFIVVGAALIPGAQELSVLRALRVLRLLRVISVAPTLRRVVEGFVTALPGMGAVFVLMAIIFYIGSVMATKLFGADFPQWFGTLGRSGYSLFQIMTLESWSMGIVRPVLEIYSWAWVFFIPFIMVTTFAVVNLLVGLIVNSMQDAHQQEENARTDAYRDGVLARLSDIEKHLQKREQKQSR